MSPAQDSDKSEPERPKSSGITPRGIGIGLLMVVVIIGMTQALSIRYDAAEVGGSAPPPAPTSFLFLYVLLAVPLLGRLNRRLALSRGELLLIYAMMLVAGPICHPHAIGFLVPHTVAPLYYNAEEPGWSLFASSLPSWLGPSTRASVVGFFHGTHGVVPWHTWLLPIVAWSSLLIVLFWVMLCINSLMYGQWSESERLTFPLAAIPLVLTEGGGAKTADGAPGLSQLTAILRAPLFWLGVAIPLVMQAPIELHKYFPSVPAIPLREVPVAYENQLPVPWNGLGDLSFSLIFWLVGIVYLLPKELAFSAWAFYLIARLETVAAIWMGTTGEPPDIYGGAFPALYAQGAGAAFALTGITLWAARRHLRSAFRSAFQRHSAGEEGFLSGRTAMLGAIGGSAFILAWLCLAGMRLWVAALLFGLLLSYFFIFARIRAETGLGMGVILWPKMLDDVVVGIVGAKFLRIPDLTVLYALRWLYHGSAVGSVMACQLEGFKLADTGGLGERRFARILALTATLTVPIAFAWTLKTYYSHGFEAMPIGQRGTSMVASQVYWSYQNLVTSHDTATGPDTSVILAMGAGALTTIALSSLRMRFLWFPLHPIGYLAANAWGMHINWISFLIGWLINVLVTRYGGLPTYRRLLPVFFGLIVGDMLHEGIWGIVTWATGGQM